MKKHSRLILIAIATVSVIVIAIAWYNISFEKAKQDDLNSRFGTRQLTSEEVDKIASAVVNGESISLK